jgi:hypothetical protein
MLKKAARFEPGVLEAELNVAFFIFTHLKVVFESFKQL